MPCGGAAAPAKRDRWLIYATVNNGEVLESDGVTAIEHRKSGSHY
jgi:hypothetical protein